MYHSSCCCQLLEASLVQAGRVVQYWLRNFCVTFDTQRSCRNVILLRADAALELNEAGYLFTIV